MLQAITERESVKVLQECIELQTRKSQDYQSPSSSIKQAMHYRRGIETIHDMIHQKMLRAQSLMDASRLGYGLSTPNFESLEDSYKDLINYASFAVAYIRGKMDGQDPSLDMFNNPKPNLAYNNYVPTTPPAPLFVGEVHTMQLNHTQEVVEADNVPRSSGPTTTSAGALGL